MSDLDENWTVGEKIFVVEGKNAPKLNARIVALNLPKRLVKLRFIATNPKPDEWFSIDSQLLQRSSKQSPTKKSCPVRGAKFAVGQHVLGAWSDGVWYPGIVAEVRSAGSIMIHFYDGLKKALRVNLVRGVSVAEYQKRLDEVLKTAEEMDRSLIQASTVTLGRTRRQDQPAVKTPIVSPVINLDQPSTSAGNNDEATLISPTYQIMMSNLDSDVDDTPLSAFASKKPRRISPRTASASKTTPEETNTARPLRSSASKTTPPSVTVSESSEPTKRTSSRQSQRKTIAVSEITTQNEPTGESLSKLRRKSANGYIPTAAAGNVTPVLAPPAKLPPTPQQNLVIVHCMCGKSRQEPGMLQCSLCMTWQHSNCCLGSKINGSDAVLREVSSSYVCSFCAHPSNAYVDLPQRIRSRVLERGVCQRFPTISPADSNNSSTVLTQLANQTEAVVGLLRKSRQLMCEIANSHRHHDKQTELVDTINTIHAHAEVLLEKIENACDAEAERISEEASNLDEYQSKKLESLTLREILNDVRTLSEILVRVEATTATSSSKNSQQQQQKSAAANNSQRSELASDAKK